MKLITIRTQIRELADRVEREWKRPDGTWKRILQKEPDTEKIHAAIVALDPETATIEDVKVAMGFDGWVETPQCDECCREVDAVVELGEPHDYESATAEICFECLQKALELK